MDDGRGNWISIALYLEPPRLTNGNVGMGLNVSEMDMWRAAPVHNACKISLIITKLTFPCGNVLVIIELMVGSIRAKRHYNRVIHCIL